MKSLFSEFYQEHRNMCFALLACVLFGIVSIWISPNDGRQKSNYAYVYEKASSTYQEDIKTYLPFVNLKGKDAKEINQKLEKIYQQKDTVLTYRYNLSGDYLSLIYCTITFKDNFPNYQFETAVFSIPKKRLLSNKEILSLYKIDEKQVREKMNDQMVYYYQDATNLGYIERNECDYACFLESREYKGTEPLHLAIQDGKLVSYQSFNIYGIYDEENYFKEDDFCFLIETSEETEDS